MVSLGRNISALKALNGLGRSTASLEKTFERLASGQRINSASDDAAGLAISDRLGADARLLSVAVRNLNDGISAINIINGTLDQQGLILGRLAELAEQSANGTFSIAQRASLQEEYQQLVAEFGRLGDTTRFNGLNLLRSSFANGVDFLRLQAGINGSSNAQLSIQGASTGSMTGTINISEAFQYDRLGDGIDLLDLFDYLDWFGNSLGAITRDEILERHNGQVFETTIRANDGTEVEVLVAFVAGALNQTSPNTLSVQVFSRTAGSNSGFQVGVDGVDSTGNGGLFSFDPSSGQIVGNTSFILQTSSGLPGATTITLDFAGLRFTSNSINNVSSSALNFTGIESASRALQALEAARQRIAELGAIRGQFGAFESRLQSALALNAVSRDVRLGARALILDADLAQESAALIRTQILQQAGVSVLTQANLQPRIALDLLQF